MDDDDGCRSIGRKISLIPSIRRCSKIVSAISFCCLASLSNFQAVCRQCWKCIQVRRTRSLSPMRSMISSVPSSFSAKSNNLSASSSYTGDKMGGVVFADIRKVISNGEEMSRFGERSTEICWGSLIEELSIMGNLRGASVAGSDDWDMESGRF